MIVLHKTNYKKSLGLFVIPLLAIVGFVWFFSGDSSSTPITKVLPTCTVETNLCPDGSRVSRAGPKCEFTQCPSTDTSVLGTFPEIPSKKILTGGSHVFQTFNNCGPAALSIVMSYFGIQKDQETLGEEIRPYRNKTGNNDNKSTSPALLSKTAEKYGLLTYNRPNGSVELLQQFVANDIPILVRTHLHLKDTIAHYRVVKGYDREAKQIIQDDSFEGKNLKFSYADFGELWRPFNNGYQIIVSKDKKAIVEKILGAELDEKLAWKNSATLAEKAIAANRNDTIAHLNLSTASFHLGDYSKSVKEFEIAESKVPLQMLWYQTEPIESYFYLANYKRVFEISDKILNGGNRAAVELYKLRARSYEAQGDNVSAQAEYAKAGIYSKKPVVR